jgi:two-component system, cell cycle sensor histidine kinase and response regulator CckA
MLMLAVYRLIGDRSNLIASRVMSSIDSHLPGAGVVTASAQTGLRRSRGSLFTTAWPVFLAVSAVIAALIMTARLVPAQGEQLVLFALSLLAVIGVFYLFAAAVGVVRLRESAAAPDVIHSFIEQSGDAVELIDAQGQVVFANAAMRTLLSMTPDSRPADRLEHLIVGEPQASEAFFRLSRAAERGEPAEELVSVMRGSAWLRLSVRRIRLDRERHVTAWRAMDVTQEQARNARALRKLNDTAGYLDALPVGFMTCHADGRVDHMNSELARWLGFDAGEIALGTLKVSEIVVGDAAELMMGVTADTDAASGESREPEARRVGSWDGRDNSG